MSNLSNNWGEGRKSHLRDANKFFDCLQIRFEEGIYPEQARKTVCCGNRVRAGVPRGISPETAGQTMIYEVVNNDTPESLRDHLVCCTFHAAANVSCFFGSLLLEPLKIRPRFAKSSLTMNPFQPPRETKFGWTCCPFNIKYGGNYRPVLRSAATPDPLTVFRQRG